MNFLSFKARPAVAAPTDDSQRVVHHEIEITVERSWMTVSVRGQSPGPSSPGSDPQPEILAPPHPPPAKFD